MPKATPTLWNEARSRWEADPSFTLTQVAAMLNVKVPTVSERAKRDGWLKMLPETQDAAQQAADVLGHISGRDELLAKASQALDLSIATRVVVLNRQRDDWQRHRTLFPHEAMASDPVCAKRAKMAAEAISIRQRGECIAYGMATMTGSDTGAPLVEAQESDSPPTMLEEAMAHIARTGKFPEWTKGAPKLGYNPDDVTNMRGRNDAEPD